MEKIEVDAYIKAGEVAKKIKDFAREFIEPGMKLIDIADGIDGKIVELGAEPAFPVNLSLNEIAAHYTPAPEDETIAEGILKVDIGVAIDGYIADTAFSIDLTKDNKFKKMIELNEKILENVDSIMDAGSEVMDIGNACQNTLEKWNNKNDSSFSIVKNLSGHNLSRDTIHAGLTIPNYKNENKTNLSNTAFAIEPFVTTGTGYIYEGKPGGIYVLQNNRQVRDRNIREFLKFITEKYKTRPFCARWLKNERFKNFNYYLKVLTKQGILYEYPMLIEKSKKPVSQVENTFVITDTVLNTTK